MAAILYESIILARFFAFLKQELKDSWFLKKEELVRFFFKK
jgi:hypothetical protein